LKKEIDKYHFDINSYLRLIMKLQISITLLIILVVANVHPHPPPVISHVPKTYKVNIDDSPMVRWAPLINDFKKPIQEFVEYLFTHIPFPKTFFREVDYFARHKFKYQDFVA
jgi:hypothetical protein